MNRIAGLRWCVMLLGALVAASAQAQAVVGRTDGVASVAATGSARYSIPLSLPPGTNGLAPALAITYDSRSGNGLLGVGFRLNGLSRVHRCGSTLAQDGRVAAIALLASDRFCLDGQKLRLTSGTHGYAGSQYQTEVETFVRVTAIGTAGNGPASFWVERRDGLVYEYGATTDSRVEATLSTTPREWALNRIRDRDGNYVDFYYTEDSANGSHRPYAIQYTGNLQTGAAPYYTVFFRYEPRPAVDVPYAFHAGGTVSDLQRLDRIDVYHGPSGRTVRSFDLGYGAPGATGRSRLATLQECAGSACYPATQFEWTSVPAGWGDGTAVPVPAAQLATSIPGDMDGDGFDDLAYQDATSRQWMVLRGSLTGLAPGAVNTGFGTDSDGNQAVATDLDGDGRREVLVPGAGGQLYRLHGSPSGGFGYASLGFANPAPPGGLIAADVDGDARDDLVYVRPGSGSIFWRRSLGGTSPSLAAEAVLWTAPTGWRLLSAPFLESEQRFRSIVRSGDFNGDGRVDLLVRAQQSLSCGKKCTNWVTRWLVLASNGATLVQSYWLDGSFETMLADFNGDSLTDIGYWNVLGQWEVLMGGGARGAALAIFAGPFPTSAFMPSAAGRAMVIDWDADGRADLLQPAADGQLHYCRAASTTIEACQPSGIGTGTLSGAPITLDANGDGFADLLLPAGPVLQHLHRSLPPDLLVAVTDGLGLRDEFEYASLADGRVHRAGSSAVFPARDYAGRSHVVSRMLAANGLRQETYYYEGARVHVQGRGFLGFARRTVTPGDPSPVRVEEYLQDADAYATLGAPWRVTLQQRSGAPLLRTTTAWSRHSYGSGYESRSFGYPSSVTVERYELDGVRVSSTVTSNVFDSYGTPIQRQTVTTEHAKGSNPYAQHVETVALTGVVNDTTNWCLGRPATTLVTRQHSLPGGAAVTRTTAHGWDFVRCRPTQQVIEPSSTALRVTTDLGYDAYGNLAGQTISPVGQAARSTSLAWSDNGRFLATQTNAEGHVSRYAWDSATGLPVSSTDPNGLVTGFTYDGFGRLVRESRPDGTSTVVTFANCGSNCVWPGTATVVSVTQRGVGDVPLASVETGHDREGREIYRRTDLPGGGQGLQVLRYDARGRLLQQSIPGRCCGSPTRWVTHAYDMLGRRVSVERPSSETVPTPAITRWRHDGLSVTETDPLGRSTTRRFDALGRIVQVVDPALVDTDYEYDAFGNMVRTRDVNGTETVLAYDVRGFRRSITDPSAGHWTFDYFPSGELRSQTNARGQVASFTYDRLSRPLSRSEPEGTTTWSWGTSVANRNVGALAAVSSPGFHEAYVYDALARPSVVTRTVAGQSLVSQLSYDGLTGRLDVLAYPSTTGAARLRVRHHYDRERLVRLTDADTGAAFWQLDAVDAFGLATGETLGNGVRVTSAYDAVTGWLVSRAAGPGGGGAHQNLGFRWDAVGNLTMREERNRGVQEYLYYDNRDRLDFVARGGGLVLDVGYDDIGNLTYKSDVGEYSYDPSRRQAVTTAGANRYSHDANGAVVSANGTTIGWRSYDLPGQITHPGGNSSAFEYGPDRARYRHVARAGGVQTETLYAADGLYERVTSGGVARERLHVVADGRRVAIQTRQAGASPTTVYLLEDHLGGVDGLTSSSGQLLARTSYHPFGARRSGDWLGTAPTSGEWQQIQATTPRGYTAHEHLDHLGIVHMNGRVYDPVLGRFLSPDPIVQAPYDTQGLNRYAYVRNNPLRYTDPTGFCFNGHPAADRQAEDCYTEDVPNTLLEVLASRFNLERDGAALAALAAYNALFESMRGAAAGLGAGGQLPEGMETIGVTAPRLPAVSGLPSDLVWFATYNLRLTTLIDRMMEATAHLGEDAVNFYVAREGETGNSLYRVPGALAALWTPYTYRQTSLVLGIGSGFGRWSARPFWQYYPAETRGYRSTWLTRGSGWTPPYRAGDEAASMLSLPAYNPGTAVRPVYPNWYEFIRGPRVVDPQPSFGPHAVGGGLEYRILPFDK
jgi:RHS repeat-associated protein